MSVRRYRYSTGGVGGRVQAGLQCKQASKQASKQATKQASKLRPSTIPTLSTAVGLYGLNSGAAMMFSNMELRLPGAQVGVAFMFICGASRSQRFFGSSISHWLHDCGQFTIIHPGLRSHSPLRASILHRRERSWHALLSTCGSFGVGGGF